MDYQTYEKKFLKKIQLVSFRRARLIPTNENTSRCPECGAKTILDMDRGERYCRNCGLVVKASIHYVGNKYIDDPYGTLLFG